MADVDGGRERRAERRTDHGARAVGDQDRPEVVLVTGRGGRLDVGHALGEVVDAQRDRRRQQRRDLAQPVDQQVDLRGWAARSRCR